MAINKKKHLVLSVPSTTPGDTDTINLMSAGAANDRFLSNIQSDSANVIITDRTAGAAGSPRITGIAVTAAALPDKFASSESGITWSPGVNIGATASGLDATALSVITSLLTDISVGDTVIFSAAGASLGVQAEITTISWTAGTAPTSGDTYDAIIISVPVATSWGNIGGGAPNANSDLYTGTLTIGDLVKLNNTTGKLEDTGIAAANVVVKKTATTNDIAIFDASGDVVDSNTLLSNVVVLSDGVTTIDHSTNKVVTASDGLTAVTSSNKVLTAADGLTTVTATNKVVTVDDSLNTVTASNKVLTAADGVTAVTSTNKVITAG